MTKKYKFHISSWKEGKYYIAQCLDVNVSSFGNTRNKALDNLEEALDLYIDDDHPPIMKLKNVRAHTFTIDTLLTENGLTVAQEKRILKASEEAKRGKNVVVANTWKEAKDYLDKLKRKPRVSEISVDTATQSKMEATVKKWNKALDKALKTKKFQKKINTSLEDQLKDV